jgi:arsenate reductase
MFSNTFAGIAPSSVPAFIVAEIIGGALAWAVVKVLYPGVTPAEAADVVVPHHLLAGDAAPPRSHQPWSPSR